MKTNEEIINFFDDLYKVFSKTGGNTKDFSPLINTLEGLLEQMRIIREISIKTKEELGECNEEEFIRRAEELLTPKLKEFEKTIEQTDDMLFKMLLLKLPDKKGKRFFELMDRLETAGALSFYDKTKISKIDSVIDDFKKYIEEIKEVNKPFIPAGFDNNQTIIFKVKFKYKKSIWRKIEMKASQTLVELHEKIQEALDWDNDHLYSFFMDNKFNNYTSENEFTCPHEAGGRRTADIPAGAFAFKKGQKFAYLFDFGDEHQFEIDVVDFGQVEKDKNYPVLLESKGKSPEQYPYFEESPGHYLYFEE